MIKLLVVSVAATAVAAGWWQALLSVGGLFRREELRYSKASFRAQLIDYMAIFAVVSPALLLIKATGNIDYIEASSLWCMSLPVLLVFLAMWWHGVRMLTALEISSAERRALFLAVLLPIIMASCPIGTVLLLLFVASLYSPDMPLMLWLAIWLVVAAIGCFLTWGIRFVQSGAKLPPEPLAAESDG